MPSDSFEGRVRSLSSDGMGVVEGPLGRVFFVPGVWTGDLGKFQPLEIKKKYGFAKLLQLIEPAEARVEAPCPHSGWGKGQCGGCPWQFVHYDAQLKAKEARLLHALKRLNLSGPDNTAEQFVKAIWPSPKVWAYRNRAQLKTDGERIGFVSPGSNTLAPIKTCSVLSEPNAHLLAAMQNLLPEPTWKPGRGFHWNFIDIDEDLAQEVLVSKLHASSFVLNRRRPFRQGNSEQNHRMREWLEEHLRVLPKDYRVLELFAGSGNFTEIVVREGFEAVCAAELVEPALNKIRSKNWSGVQTAVADLFRNSAYRSLRQVSGAADILILDPPREGLKEKTGLLKDYPELREIFYISCDVATFVRDLTDFVRAGFVIREIQPLDMFPHTPHLEILCHLQRA